MCVITIIGVSRAEHLVLQVIFELCCHSETSNQEMPIYLFPLYQRSIFQYCTKRIFELFVKKISMAFSSHTHMDLKPHFVS